MDHRQIIQKIEMQNKLVGRPTNYRLQKKAVLDVLVLKIILTDFLPHHQLQFPLID